MTKQMISFTDPQRVFLAKEAERLGIPIAELVRRTVDAYMVRIEPHTADRPSSDELTQRYRAALHTLNLAPIGRLTVSDLNWLTGHLRLRWVANGARRDLEIPWHSKKKELIKRLEALVEKVTAEQ